MIDCVLIFYKFVLTKTLTKNIVKICYNGVYKKNYCLDWK